MKSFFALVAAVSFSLMSVGAATVDIESTVAAYATDAAAQRA